MMREVILDTETTGLKPEDGNRIVEIGCVEVINRKLTGETFHTYLNPERDIEEGAFRVHGLSREFLSDKPLFKDIESDLLSFIDKADIVIHNAGFDMAFLDSEFTHAKTKSKPLRKNKIIDSLTLARKLHPGQRNSLDNLAKRYNVDSYDRSLHGALLDARILADVYLLMTGGQVKLNLDQSEKELSVGEAQDFVILNLDNIDIVSCQLDEAEINDHKKWREHYKI